jgi:hypothetical protein
MLADGNVVSSVQLECGPALVGYQSRFQWKWVATKLHLFTVVVAVPVATSENLAAVTAQATDYAKRTKGKLRGFQTGVAVLPALVADEVLPEARMAAEARPKTGWAVFVLPAIADLNAQEMYSYRGRLVWGGVYASWLRERLGAVVAPPERTDESRPAP